jgi:hypothetical protein
MVPHEGSLGGPAVFFVAAAMSQESGCCEGTCVCRGVQVTTLHTRRPSKPICHLFAWKQVPQYHYIMNMVSHSYGLVNNVAGC